MAAAELPGQFAWLLAAIGAVFGLLLGSFLNVVIYRLPKMLERQWAAEAREFMTDGAAAVTAADAEPDAAAAPFNLAVPRSHCPACGHAIAWYENIPVFSYLALRGRCSACRAPIGMRYPLVELLTGALLAACAWRWGLTWTALAWCGFAAALVALAGIDWDTTLLPDDLTLPLLWAGLIVAALGLTGVTVADAVWGAAAGYLALWAVYWAFRLVTGKEGMGITLDPGYFLELDKRIVHPPVSGDPFLAEVKHLDLKPYRGADIQLKQLAQIIPLENRGRP